jgi:hypothetical protein
MGKNLILSLFIICVHGFYPDTASAHEGVTPFEVLTNMRREGAGPYASPAYKDSLIHGWLGISAENATSDKENIGVLVTGVRADSPAERGGLEPGDIIIELNGFSVHSVDDLELLMSKINQPGEYSFTLIREGEEESEDVYLEASLKEMDPQMYKLIMEKRGRFEPGMLQEDIMGKMFGSEDQQGALGGVPQPFTPGRMMQQMLENSPMGRRKNGQGTPTLPTAENKLTAYLKKQLAGYLKYSNQLRLSPSQLDKLQKLDTTHQKQLIAQRAKAKVAELELEEALNQDNIDLEATTRLTNRLTKLRQENMQQELELLKQLQQILTNEQKTKYQRLIKQPSP